MVTGVAKHIKSLVVVFIMSFITLFFATPVSAYDITTSVSPTGKSWEWGNAGWLEALQISGSGEYNKTNTGAAIFWGRGWSQSGLSVHWILKSVATGGNIEFVEGNYYKTQLSWNVVGYTVGTAEQNPYGIQLPILNRMVFPANSPYKLVSVTPQSVQCYEASNYFSSNATGALLGGQTGCYRGNVVYDIIVQATRTATGKLQLGDGAQWMFQSYVGFNNPTGYGTLTPLTITEYEPTDIDKTLQNEKQENEQQGEQGNSQSNTAGQQVEQGTQNILSVLTGFIGAFTSASASNCNFNTGEILGNIDMCSTQIPAVYNVILSIVTIIIVVPMVIWLFNSIINAFKEFQT